MNQLILFQEFESLNYKEYEKFLTSYFPQTPVLFNFLSYDRDFASNILMHGFRKELVDNKMNNINRMLNIINEIIKSRTKNQNNVPLSTPNPSLPLEILSEISSFLQPELQMIGSHSIYSPTYPESTNPFTKWVTFCDEQYHRNNLQDKFRLHQLKIYELLYVGYNRHIMEFDDCMNTNNLIKYIEAIVIRSCSDNLNLIVSDLNEYRDLSKVKTLRFFGEDEPLKSDIMNELISLIVNRFKLKYFEMMIHFGAQFKFNNYEWMKKLKGLAITNIYEDGREDILMRNIYSSIDSLESLHVSNGKLNNLKEICMPRYILRDIQTREVLMQQTLDSLRRLHFRDFSETTHDFIQYTELFMCKVIKSVEYIVINMWMDAWSDDALIQMFNILIHSLQNTKKHTLTIRINELMLDDDLEHVVEFVNVSKQLINILNESCVNWQIIFYDLEVSTGDMSHDNLLEELKDKCSGKIINRSHCDLVLQNTECDLNQHHMKWIMECDRCAEEILFFD